MENDVTVAPIGFVGSVNTTTPMTTLRQRLWRVDHQSVASHPGAAPFSTNQGVAPAGNKCRVKITLLFAERPSVRF